MTEVTALLVSIAAVVCSAVVPFVSVRFAQRLVHRDALRQSVRDAFLGINRHMLGYHDAILACCSHKQVVGKGWQFTRESISEQKPTIQPYLAKLKEMQTLLSGDILMLGLLFDNKSMPLGTRIQQLMATSRWVLSDVELPLPDACQAVLRKEMDAIQEQIVVLWESLK